MEFHQEMYKRPPWQRGRISDMIKTIPISLLQSKHTIIYDGEVSPINYENALLRLGSLKVPHACPKSRIINPIRCTVAPPTQERMRLPPIISITEFLFHYIHIRRKVFELEDLCSSSRTDAVIAKHSRTSGFFVNSASQRMPRACLVRHGRAGITRPPVKADRLTRDLQAGVPTKEDI